MPREPYEDEGGTFLQDAGNQKLCPQCNYTQDVNPEPQHCGNLRSRVLRLFAKIKLLRAWAYQSKACALSFSSN